MKGIAGPRRKRGGRRGGSGRGVLLVHVFQGLHEGGLHIGEGLQVCRDSGGWVHVVGEMSGRGGGIEL